MLKARFVLIIICVLMIVNTGAAEPLDLFAQKRSDAAIKPLVFPLSLVVVENRPENMPYFFENGSKKLDLELNEESGSGGSGFGQSISNPKIIRKTLVALDRARINPSEQGEDLRGAFTKETLKEIAHKYSKDLVLVFRREIRVISDFPIPQPVFQKPDQLFDLQKTGPYFLRIRSLGLVFIAKGNKILVVPPNEKSQSISTAGESFKQNQVMTRIDQLSRQGLEDLSAAAKKIIKDNEFVVRRSAY